MVYDPTSDIIYASGRLYNSAGTTNSLHLLQITSATGIVAKAE